MSLCTVILSLTIRFDKSKYTTPANESNNNTGANNDQAVNSLPSLLLLTSAGDLKQYIATKVGVTNPARLETIDNTACINPWCSSRGGFLFIISVNIERFGAPRKGNDPTAKKNGKMKCHTAASLAHNKYTALYPNAAILSPKINKVVSLTLNLDDN
mmetsp:Transcript_50041/g.50397  ORF Transcript_50041/g.50397 Transcript_50041/m.50397 type:complete len:157 (+) Transcript_50041:136-606(+)